MTDIDVLVYQVAYDVQVGYALYSDAERAVQRAELDEAMQSLDERFFLVIVAHGLKRAAMEIAGWGLPKDEYQLICDTFSAEVRGLTRILDRRED